MPERKTYRGRPCYIRQAIYIDYLDTAKPISEFLVIVDDDENTGSLDLEIVGMEFE